MSNLQTTDQSIAIARIEGPIDLDHASKTRRMLLDSLANQKNVLVDMSAVTEIDSAGVASLVEALWSRWSHPLRRTPGCTASIRWSSTERSTAFSGMEA